jgi:hypothetical protein
MPDISVDYEEMAGSPAESIGANGFEATRILRCAWADRITLARELGGEFDGTIDLPQVYPHDAGARVVEIPSIAGHDDDAPTAYLGNTRIAAYQYALLTVKYGRGVPASGGGGGSPELTDETVEPLTEFVTLSPKGMTWGSLGGTPLENDEAPGMLLKSFNWVFTRMNVSDIPAAVDTLIGNVNNSTIESRSLGFTFSPETLLYTPPFLSRKVNADGVTSRWTIQFRFSRRPQGWNKFFRPETNAWDSIYKGATQVKPYPLGDFLTLIV